MYKKITIASFILLLSTTVGAEYLITFNKEKISIPEKTIPEISEALSFRSTYAENNSVINSKNSFTLKYQYHSSGNDEVILKFDMDTMITGVTIKDVSCPHSTTGYNGSSTHGVTMNIRNQSESGNYLYQRHYQYNPGNRDDDNERKYFKNGSSLSFSGDYTDRITGDSIGRKNKYPINENDRDRYDDNLSDLVGYYIPFIEPMDVKKEDGIRIYVSSSRSTYYTGYTVCSSTYDFTFEEI